MKDIELFILQEQNSERILGVLMDSEKAQEFQNKLIEYGVKSKWTIWNMPSDNKDVLDEIKEEYHENHPEEY